MLVKAWLETHDKNAKIQIRSYLVAWQNNEIHLQPLFAGNSRLMEVQEHSKNLSLAATIGLEALERVEKAGSPDTVWMRQQATALDLYAKPHGNTEIAVIPEIAALVDGSLPPEPTAYKIF